MFKYVSSTFKYSGLFYGTTFPNKKWVTGVDGASVAAEWGPLEPTGQDNRKSTKN